MGLLYLLPNASSGNNHLLIDDPVGLPDDGATLLTPESSNFYDTYYFGVENINISNINISNVSLFYRGITRTDPTLYFAAGIAIDSVRYYDTLRYDMTYTSYTKSYLNNPKTNSSWTINDVNNLQIVCTLRGRGKSGDSSMTQMYLIVTYVLPGGAACLLI